MRPSPLLRWLFSVTLAAWSLWHLWVALKRFRFQSVCAMACPPFMDAELVPLFRQAMDWERPLVLALVPLAVVGAVWAGLRFSQGSWLRH